MQNAYMETTGQKLQGLIDRSGLSQSEAATRGGYSRSTGIQRFTHPDYDGRLPIEVAARLAFALQGEGGVLARDIIELSGVLPNEEKLAEMLDGLLNPELYSEGRPAAIQALARMLPEAFSRVLAENPPPVEPRGR